MKQTKLDDFMPIRTRHESNRQCLPLPQSTTNTDLVLRATARDRSSGSEDSRRDVIERDINRYPKVKYRGWRSLRDTEGTTYGRHQGKREHIKHSTVEDGDGDGDGDEDEDEEDNENENDAGTDTEARRPKESRGGHQERGRRLHNEYVQSDSGTDAELGRDKTVQSERRNDSLTPQVGGSRSRNQSTTSARTIRDDIARSAGVGDSRSRHQSTTSARTIRDHSPSPTERAEMSPRSSSPTPSQHSASRRSTSASDQHEQHDPPESDKDIDKGSTAPEPEILDSSRESNEERPAPQQPDVGSTSHSGGFCWSQGSKYRREVGHTRKGDRAYVRPSRKRG